MQKAPFLTKVKRLFHFFGIFLLTFTFAIGIIFSVEIGWRVLAPTASRANLIDLTLFPYQHYVVTTHPKSLILGNSQHILEGYFDKFACLDEKGASARFNSHGYRTHEFHSIPPKTADEIRIIITGGSSAISWNINEACTLDTKLYQRFSKHYPGKKVTIINLGNGAWKSFQELIALQLHGLKMEPDLIIAFDGFNDIQHSYSMPIERPYNNNAEISFERYKAFVEGKVLELFNSLKIIDFIKRPTLQAVGMIGRTKEILTGTTPLLAEKAKPGWLATQMNYPLDSEAIAKRSDFDPYNQEVVHFYLQNERFMANVAKAVKAKMIIALQPVLYLKTPLTQKERSLLNTYASSVNFVVQGYERMREGLLQIEKEEKHVKFFDASRLFSGEDSAYFFDYCHFNAGGYDILADKLFDLIQESLALKNTLDISRYDD